jgi:short-subunit dehydrogenase
MPTALVTGATSGIGNHFARRLAREGYDLVLVARTVTKLTALATELTEASGAGVEVLPADLGNIGQCAAVEQRLAQADRPVDLLINNAGIGLYADSFANHSIEAEEQLLRVNVRAVMRLCHATLGPMMDRGHGDILNISSVASFAPDATAPTYAASKAWVTSFSEGLRAQLAGTDVRVTVVTPGLVPTDFQRSAGVEPHAPAALWLDPDDVVETALRDLRSGHGVSIPGLQYRAVALAMRLTPRRLYLPIARRLTDRIT